ncbi:MAG: glycosyltransferase [Muribaculaceae bacterium]|nr:glycosyltransferase [Muribaculaceae bacterium]
MVVGYGGRKIVMENNDTSYYGRILIKALAKHYPDNYYILYSPDHDQNKRLTALLNEEGVRVKFPRSHIHDTNRWYTHTGIVKSAKAHGVNTFHGIDDGIPSGFAGGSFPTVFTMTDPLYKTAKNWFIRMKMQRRARKACKIAKRIIALHEPDRQTIINHYHVSPDIVEVVHPCFFDGCDDSVPENMYDILTKKYRLPERFILYKGRLDKDDNLGEAMKLIHELRNRKISIVMLGYRTNHFDHVVKEQAHNLHIFHRFKQVDKVHHSDLTAVCKMAEAVIIPNTERIRDLYKLINAQRSGGLVICKDSPQAREFGGEGAIYYTDFEDGADKLSDVLEDENKIQAILKAARENSERFTSQVLADHMVHIYRSILMHRRLFKK